ncbi:MAG: hypothetical protein GWN29_00420 [Gammaproteobacteria bacterium]|nr:hypothetical protein [Gammaproteobacteria bacterium]
MSLQRPDGASVEMLPAATRIDFAELSTLSELLASAFVAPGDLVGGSIRVDYTNAEIYVESGGGVVLAEAVDDAGAPLGVVDLQIELDDRERLVITRGRTAFLSIDFDLAASHDVDLGFTPARVTTRPYLSAEVRPLDEKELRVRGPLVDVDTTAGTYDIRVRPWHRRDGDFGTFTVYTTPTTTFEIGDASYTGAPGLTALESLGAGALTVAFGTLDVTNRQFTAEIVHAGDSVGGDRFSAVHGNVVARSGDTLTVKGALAVHRDRPAHYRRTVLVEIGDNTRVSKVGDAMAAFDKDDISVGQRIVAFGQFTNPQVASDDPLGPDIALILDATQGRVRMLVTRLHGTVNSVVPGQLNMRLRGIDRLGIDLFHFAGTGVNAMADADPLDYEVATGTLALNALEVDKPARVFGFVTPFGEAPPDFIGRTVVDHRDIPAALGIGWGLAGTATPFSSMNPTGLVLDMSNPQIGGRHHLLLGRELVDLFDLAGPATIAPAGTRGLYGIWEPGHIEQFADFADFHDEVVNRLGAGSNAQALAAYGTFDESSLTLSARKVFVHMTLAP